ncbi:amino acid/polyamine transporter I [Phycomyces blakesleeanus]
MVDAGSLGVIWGWVATSFFTVFISMSLAEICIGITSVDLSLAQFVAGIINIWRPGVEITIYMQYGVFVGILIFHGLINSLTVSLNGIMNQAAFWVNLLGILFIVIVGLVFTRPLASGYVVFTQFYNGSGFSSNGYAFLLVILQAQYTLTGYDCAAYMSEETKNSQTGTPLAIVVAVLANAFTGLIFLIGVGFMVKNFMYQIVSEEAIQPQMVQVFHDGVGPGWTMVFLVFIILSTFFCGSSMILAGSRMAYAFARDGAMPFSKKLYSLNAQTKSPIIAVWFNIIVSGIIGILYIVNDTAFEAIVSINTIGAQTAYLIPIVLRITVSRTKFVPGPWNLGRFSIAIGYVSSFWLIFTCVLFICPTEAPVTASNMNYAIVPFGVIMGLSIGYYMIWGYKWFTGPVRIVNGEVVIEDDYSAQTMTC